VTRSFEKRCNALSICTPADVCTPSTNVGPPKPGSSAEPVEIDRGAAAAVAVVGAVVVVVVGVVVGVAVGRGGSTSVHVTCVGVAHEPHAIAKTIGVATRNIRRVKGDVDVDVKDIVV